MLNGKTLIIHLIVGLIKKTLYNTFLNYIEVLEETLMSKSIYLIMQQKQI